MKKLGQKNGLKWINEYFDNEDYIILKISKPETKESYDVFIDKDDFEKVYRGQWFVHNRRKKSKFKDIYSVTWSKIVNGNVINYDIYQFILNTKNKNLIVDHINRDRFDNRKSNLRIVDAKTNRLNQDITYKMNKGYRFEEKTNSYLTRISINGKHINIGRYKTEQEARNIYLKSCILLGYDKVSEPIKDIIELYNIYITESDYNNKYIKKVIAIRDNTYEKDVFNGRLNRGYDKCINIIVELRDKGNSWKHITQYLLDNNLIEKANEKTIKKYYDKFIKNKILN